MILIMKMDNINVGHAVVYFAGKMNKMEKRLYISTPKTEAGVRKIPLVKGGRNALEEIKHYQSDNGIFCKAESNSVCNGVC